MNGLWIEMAWKSAVVLGATFGASYALRRTAAAVRHFVWTAAFAMLLLLPAAAVKGPRWSAPDVRPAPSTVQAQTIVVRGSRPAASPRFRFELLYLAGALLVAGRFAVGIARTMAMVGRARTAPHAEAVAEEVRRSLGIRRPVRALASADAPVPMAWGILRPVALLPAGSHEWPAARLRAVLLHELVHVQRHDLAVQMLAQLACVFYWFQPLAWFAARELRRERERACDDAVLDRGIAPADYAGHLMELARSMTAAAAPAMAESSDLESRVRALLDRGQNRAPLTRRAAMTVAALACAVALPLATLTTHAQTQAGRGALAGIVTDPSGARVPGCSVSIQNLDGDNQESAKVNAAGEYLFASIPPGRYSVEVRAAGFRIGTKEVVVTANTAARMDVSLEVGRISEVVTVRGTRTTPAAPPSQAMRSPERIPIGGSVRAARLITQARPVYPAELKQQGITGHVMIAAVISKTGETLNPRVLNTDVHPGLAQAALDAVKQWRYEPTLLNGQPVEVVTSIDVVFELDQ
jgi:TonB family protein